MFVATFEGARNFVSYTIDKEAAGRAEQLLGQPRSKDAIATDCVYFLFVFLHRST